MFQRVMVGWFRPRDPQAVQGQAAGGFSMGGAARAAASRVGGAGGRRMV